VALGYALTAATYLFVPALISSSYGRSGLQDRRVVGTHDEVIARVENFLICRAAYEKALFVYPTDRLEMRQGARVVMRSKEDG
jgi:hypothetical protein